eukprot:6088234-Pyramimonas_sp.AAC.1
MQLAIVMDDANAREQAAPAASEAQAHAIVPNGDPGSASEVALVCLGGLSTETNFASIFDASAISNGFESLPGDVALMLAE